MSEETESIQTEVPLISEKRQVSVDSVSKFCSIISERLTVQSEREELRLVSDGIFIPEQMLPRFIAHYETWIDSETGKHDASAGQRCTARLKQDKDGPLLWYVLEGKVCMVGYVLEVAPEHHPKNISLFRGSPMDARSYLHFRDPLLQENGQHRRGEVQAIFDAQGLRLKIETENKGQFYCSPQVLVEFLQLSRNIKSVVAKHPEILQAARYALPALFQSVARAKPLPPKTRLLVPVRFRNTPMRTYRLGDSIFFVNEKNDIVHFYGLRGKNLHAFLRAEYEAVKAKQQGKSVGEFLFPRKPGRSIGVLRIGQDMYFIEPAAMKEFIELAPLAWELNKELNGHYTVADCMKHFAKCFIKTKRCEERDLPRSCVPDKLKKLRFHQTESFVFVSNERRAIVSVLPKFKIEQKGRAPKRNARREARPIAK